MNEAYLRSLVKTWAAAGPLPFYDTINIEQNPSDLMWATIIWEPASREKMTYCDDALYEGSFQMLYMTLAGTGDDALLAAAEAALTVFMQNVDPAGRLVLIDVDPPADFLTEDSAPLFGVAYRVNYELQ